MPTPSPSPTDATTAQRTESVHRADDNDETTAADQPRSRRRFLARPVLRAVLAGILLAGSLPPWGWWPLAFVGIAVLDRLLADARWQARLGRGTVVGLALFGPTIVWITQLTLPGYVVAVLVFAGLTGLFTTAVPPNRGRRIGLMGAWMLSESLRMAWPFGGVPLSLLAVGQVGGPLAGLARLGGVLAITGATVAVGVALSALFDLARSSRFLSTKWSPHNQIMDKKRPMATVAVSFGVVALLLLVDITAPHGHDTNKRIDIALVQGGGAQGTRAINTDRRKVFERHLAASAKVPGGLDLVLWPEDVVDTDGPVQQSEEGRELQALARRLEATLIVGTVEDVSDTEFRNSSQALTPNGTWEGSEGRYVKVQRVPFGEWVPFRSFIEQFAPDTLATRDATVSHESGLLRTKAAPLAVVISWEVFFGHRARSGVRAGGQLLYNPTNGSTYTGTFVQTQQIASSRLRAIETGRWLVQVAPTGFSAFVGPDGQVHQRTPQREQAVRVRRNVALRTGQTWYVRWGDLPPRVIAALLLAIGWALAFAGDERRRRPVPLDQVVNQAGG